MQNHPESPIQPLSWSFLQDSVKAFLRFLVWHPLLVIFSILLTSAPYLLLYDSTTNFRNFWHSTVSLSVEVATLLVISPLALEFLKTQKSSETSATIFKNLRATSTFLKDNALPFRSPLKWPVLFGVSLFVQAASTAITSRLHFPTNQQHNLSTLGGIVVDNVFTAASMPLLLLMGGFLLLIPLQSLTNLFQAQFNGDHVSPLGGPILAFFLTPLVPHRGVANTYSLHILKTNNFYHLNTLFFAWNALRILAAPLALAPLLDAFSFAALLHASLGGTPSPKTATANAPAQMQPTT